MADEPDPKMIAAILKAMAAQKEEEKKKEEKTPTSVPATNLSSAMNLALTKKDDVLTLESKVTPKGYTNWRTAAFWTDVEAWKLAPQDWMMHVENHVYEMIGKLTCHSSPNLVNEWAAIMLIAKLADGRRMEEVKAISDKFWINFAGAPNANKILAGAHCDYKHIRDDELKKSMKEAMEKYDKEAKKRDRDSDGNSSRRSDGYGRYHDRR
eukprot:GILI01009605.1.p2 GENE.GILI01009605.1~~GILI01009605.1.p2  ORF type:complete len:210 (-),score=42.05 GILI01009605.1:1673-2302(-)